MSRGTFDVIVRVTAEFLLSMTHARCVHIGALQPGQTLWAMYDVEEGRKEAFAVFPSEGSAREALRRLLEAVDHGENIVDFSDLTLSTGSMVELARYENQEEESLG
jgi:hypothetical protein